MKFLAIFCFLAFTAAEEIKTQDQKTQPLDAVQNASSLIQTTNTHPNGQLFTPTSFTNLFTPSEALTNLAYTGLNGNVSPIQTVNSDLFANPAAGAISVNPNVPVNGVIPINAGIPVNPTIPVNGVIPVNPTIPVNGAIPINGGIPVNAAIPSFPVTRTVLPGTNAVVNGIQSPFPVTGNVFPAVAAIPTAVNGIPPQLPGVVSGILPGVSGVPTGTIDPNTAANGVISPVAAPAFRFLTPDALSGVVGQGLQLGQQVGLAAIPAFTSGILSSLTNGALQSQLQGQNLQTGFQQILKGPSGNPTGIPAGIPNTQGVTGANISTGPLTNVFRQA